MEPPTQDEEQLLGAYRDMLERDIALLETLLADEYALTHLTGYRQSRAEWLDQIRAGAMRYHHSNETSVTVNISGDVAVVVGQNVVDANIWGSRGTWQLQLTTHYARTEHGWKAQHTEAATY